MDWIDRISYLLAIGEYWVVVTLQEVKGQCWYSRVRYIYEDGEVEYSNVVFSPRWGKQ